MRDKVFYDKPVEACYGCKACEQICSHGAIEMQASDEGFAYPVIDTSRCVDCDLCERSCPTQDENIVKLLSPAPPKVWAAWNKNLSDRLESSSGGIFFLLASQVIHAGGVVYGADYKDDLTVYHRRFDDCDTLRRARGSKYVQSDMRGVYRQVREDLKRGGQVLFSGVPCQVAGLKLFLRKAYDNLLTVDLVCHGVPSPMFFQMHVKHMEEKYGDKIVDFKFRAKKRTGWRSYVKCVFRQRNPKYFFWGGNYYSHAFHMGYFNRDSCYTCDFSKSERIGDITLGDFWGSESQHAELKKVRKYGFNLVMCNTERGRELFESITEQIMKREYPLQIATSGDVRLRHTEPRPAMRENAYKLLRERGYEYMESTFGLKETFVQRMVPTFVKNLIREVQSRL